MHDYILSANNKRCYLQVRVSESPEQQLLGKRSSVGMQPEKQQSAALCISSSRKLETSYETGANKNKKPPLVIRKQLFRKIPL